MANVIKIIYFKAHLNTQHTQGLYLHVLGLHMVKVQCVGGKNKNGAFQHKKPTLLPTKLNKTNFK